MASIVFLRGVNVGGHKAFRPSLVVERLKSLEVASIGAAGTFVVRAEASPEEIRRAFARALSFETTLMICSARDLAALIESDPFAGAAKADGAYVTVLERRPARLPRLPLDAPEGRDWKVRVIAARGCFVTSLTRRMEGPLLYPNEVVEKRLGVAATTRGWPTFLKIREALEKTTPVQRATTRSSRKTASRPPRKRGRA